MNMKRSEFVLGALSVAFLGCTKNIIAGDTKNIKETGWLIDGPCRL